jgi:hypothetical protein
MWLGSMLTDVDDDGEVVRCLCMGNAVGVVESVLWMMYLTFPTRYLGATVHCNSGVNVGAKWGREDPRRGAK